MFCECGTGSFKHVDEDDVGCGGGSPRGIRRKHGGKVNPYAGRGLDRFSVVVSELETQRARILRRVGSDDDTGLVLVRFAVQSNGGWTPVVVKLPEQPLKRKQGGAATAKKPRAAASSAAAAPPLPLPPAPASPTSPLDRASSPRERVGGVKKATATATKQVPATARKAAAFSWGRRVRRPSYYLPTVVVLTLVSLALFGRVFAICLTSIWWYVLPTLSSRCYDDGAGGEDARRAGLRRSMEKRKLVSPPPPPHAKKGSSWGVLEVVSSPRGHAKGKRG